MFTQNDLFTRFHCRQKVAFFDAIQLRIGGCVTKVLLHILQGRTLYCQAHGSYWTENHLVWFDWTFFLMISRKFSTDSALKRVIYTPH